MRIQVSINFENGLSSEQNKKNFKKLSPLPAEYVNIKKLFTLPGNPDEHLWAPLCSINFEDMSNFPNFAVACDQCSTITFYLCLRY